MPSLNPRRAIRVFKNHQDQEDETRRFWLDKSIAEKMAETAALVRYAYGLQGIDVDVKGSERTLVRVQRAQG